MPLILRPALIDMIAFIEKEHGLSRELADISSSAAVDLTIGQVIDMTNDTVSAILERDVFEPRGIMA